MGKDDDSSCSSGDELLNFTMMSQPSPVKTDETKDEAQDENDVDQEGNNADSTEAMDAKCDPKAKESVSAVDEDKSQRIASSVPIDKRLDSPDSLYWHVCKKKKKLIIFPVRIPPNESEYIGYLEVLKKKLDDKKIVVQYVQFPHAEISSKDIGLYAVIPKSQLVPYHGDYDDKDRWCPDLSKKYFQQLKKQHKRVGDQQVRVEELYLQRILKKAKDELESTANLEQYDVAVEEPDELKEEELKPFVNNQEIDSDIETDGGNRRSKRHRSDDENKDWLHVGDVIKLFKPNTLSGLPENLRYATIKAINPRDDYALTVDCDGEWNMIIPNDHPIMRVKRNERGKLVDCIGNAFWPVESFTMKREGDKNARKKLMDEKVRGMKEIFDKNKRAVLEKIEKDGCGPTDMLR